MRPNIIPDESGEGQPAPRDELARAKIEFTIESIVPKLAANGFILLPGFSKWLDFLSPLTQQEAWQAFKDKNVVEIIRTHPKQQQRFFLNDKNQVDETPQLDVNFEVKTEKSHLTIIEGAEAVADSPLLPNSVRSYLKMGNEFAADVRSLLKDILPLPDLPTVVKVRIFEYHASDPLAGMRPFRNSAEAQKAHTDGSVFTLIVAHSDGLLRFSHHGHWFSAIRPDKRPFTLLIPGVAAARDYAISPTPHLVLTGAERRISITAFLTPALSSNRQLAEQQIAHWRLLKAVGTSNEISFSL